MTADPTLSQAIQEAYASAPADEIVLDTLELRHASFIAPIRVVRNHADDVSWGAGGVEAQAVLDALSVEDRELVGLVARLEVTAPENAGEMVAFIALGFDMDLPPVDTLPVPEISVTMDNVSREISDSLEAASISQEKIEVIYRPFLVTDLEGPQQDPPLNLELTEARASGGMVRGQARMFDVGNKAFPGKTYTAPLFPSLVR